MKYLPYVSLLIAVPTLATGLSCAEEKTDFEPKTLEEDQGFAEDFDPYGQSGGDDFATIVDLADWSTENRTSTIRILDLTNHETVWSMRFTEEEEEGLILDAQIVGSHIASLMFGSLLINESDASYADKYLSFINADHEFEQSISLGIPPSEQGSGTRSDPHRGEVHHSLAGSEYDADNNVAVIMRTGNIAASEYPNPDPNVDFVLTDSISMIVYPKSLEWSEDPEEIEILRLHEIIADPNIVEDDIEEPNGQFVAFELFHANGLRYLGMDSGQHEYLISLARINAILRFVLPSDLSGQAEVTGLYFGAESSAEVIELFTESSYYQSNPYPIYTDQRGIVRDTSSDAALVNAFTFQHGPDLGGANLEVMGVFSNNTASTDIVGYSQAVVFAVDNASEGYSAQSWTDVDMIVHSFGAVTLIEDEDKNVVGGITSTGVNGQIQIWQLTNTPAHDQMTVGMDIQYEEVFDFGHILPGEPEVYTEISEFVTY